MEATSTQIRVLEATNSRRLGRWSTTIIVEVVGVHQNPTIFPPGTPQVILQMSSDLDRWFEGSQNSYPYAPRSKLTSGIVV